jgi:hypothetical protein
MKESNNESIIYKVINEINDFVYIGATRKTIAARKRDQIQQSVSGKNIKFYNAIRTYGVEAFKWEQIDTAISENELAKKEKEYILEYNTIEEGYNSDVGGGIKKTVYQYGLEGNYLNSYSCLDDAGKHVEAQKQQISRACLNRKISKGFYWSYDYVEKLISINDSRKKKVYQLTLDGELVNEFESVSEASKISEFNKSSIAKVCRGERKQCGNYKWQYIY